MQIKLTRNLLIDRWLNVGVTLKELGLETDWRENSRRRKSPCLISKFHQRIK